jgi:hypothetical protein
VGFADPSRLARRPLADFGLPHDLNPSSQKLQKHNFFSNPFDWDQEQSFRKGSAFTHQAVFCLKSESDFKSNFSRFEVTSTDFFSGYREVKTP